MKLWTSASSINEVIEQFTVGNDRVIDLNLAYWDIVGSMAHARMLHDVGIISGGEADALLGELKNLLALAEKGELIIEPGMEDIHSQVEFLLTQKLGDTGKKIHTARSRNDQVLLDIKLFVRNQLEQIVRKMQNLFAVLQENSERYKEVFLPGFTHFQLAMPSSFGLWFGMFAESLADDILAFLPAFEMANRNPLGSAAGYGSSFPINRSLSTKLLGFSDLDYNAGYAQFNRGKFDRALASAISSLAYTMGKFATDACVYTNTRFAFLRLPEEMTTGSSIMPHKKNPDVFELLRGKCNILQALPNQIALQTTNLPTGYYRDYQLLKEPMIEALQTLNNCLDVLIFAVPRMEVNISIPKEEYQMLYSVEEVNKLVQNGTSFRDAYHQVAAALKMGTYAPEMNFMHTHEGSNGNLCNDKIALRFQANYEKYHFEAINNAINELVSIR